MNTLMFYVITCVVFMVHHGTDIQHSSYHTNKAVPEQLVSTAIECASACLRAGDDCSGYEISNGECHLLYCHSNSTFSGGAEVNATKDGNTCLPTEATTTVSYIYFKW